MPGLPHRYGFSVILVRVCGDGKMRSFDRYKSVLKMVLANSGIAVIPPILVLIENQHASWHALWNTFRYSLIYANCIGTLASLTMPIIWRAACRYSMWLQWVLRIASLFVAAILGTLAASVILIAFGWLSPRYYWVEFAGSFKIALFLTFLAGGIIGMYETMRARLNATTLELRTKELERERALKLATEAQLASLESRIHPHFLFNTLNSISSLIPEDPVRAERLVEQMAALLRFSLDANQSGLVPLSAEMKVVADYLEIEQARFGDRLHYRIDIPPETGEARVPPLAIQTLVENSVKFAVAPNRNGGDIRIAGVRENGLLRVEVSDAGPEFAIESAPSGHGLDNLKDRLKALFGAGASLTLERRDNRNNMRLSVPQAGNGHQSIPG